jgi:hypothetical protein
VLREFPLERFTLCLESGKYAAKLPKHLTDAQKESRSYWRPMNCVIGLTDPNGSEIKVGAQKDAVLKAAIDSLLVKQ